MAGTTDILVNIKGNDQVSGVLGKIKNGSAGLTTAMGTMMTGAGMALASYGKSAIDSAVQAESAWNRFGANINSQGGNWNTQSQQIKSFISDFSTSMGRTVGDTRNAATALMNYGMTWNETKNGMTAVAGLAAKTGSTQEEASNIIVSALNGRANALRKATGLEIANYKAADGTIDRARLLQDIANNTKEARSMFADSDEAKINRLEGAMAKLKTTIGQGMMSLLEPLIPFITNLVKVIADMPGPFRTIISAITVGFTGLMLIGGPLTSLIGLVKMFGGGLSSLTGILGGLNSIIGVNTTVESANASTTLGSAMAHSSSANSKILEQGATSALTKGIQSSNIVENQSIFGKIRSSIASKTKALSERASAAATRLSTIATNLNITATLRGVISKIRDTMTNMSNTLSKVANRLITMAGAAAEYILAAAKSFLTVITTASTTGFLGNTIATITNTASKVAQVAITITTTVATGVLTAAQWALNVAMNANPIGIVIIALVALVAIIYKVGQAFGWWNSFNGMLNRIWQGLQGIWNALTKIKPEQVFNGLKSAIMILFTPIVALISLIKVLWAALTGQDAGNIFGGVINNIRSGLSQIGNLLMNGLTTAFNIFIGHFVTLPQRIWENLIKIIVRFITFRQMVFTRIAEIGMQILVRVGNALKGLPQRVWTFLQQTLIRFVLFGVQAFIRARNAGLRILNGILTFVRTIPSRVASFFRSVVGRIIAFAGAAFSAAASVGSRVVQGVINYVKNLPNRVFNEFLNIGNRIKEAAAFVVKKATEFAKGIADAVLNTLGIHSPGIIQDKIALEFANIPSRIVNQTTSAYRAAQSFSNSILTGFGNPSLNAGTVLNGLNNRLDNQLQNSLNGVVNLNNRAPSDKNTTNIYNFQEGAFDNKFDARSFTEDECKAILYNAVDGLQ